jgi:phage shock protein PspC (stress-responsive transcriptional regulator)
MRRSFSDRVFGGVCGGIAAGLRAPAWLVRGLFSLLILLSLGAFGVLYVVLWWLMPLESPLERRRGLPTILVLALVLACGAAWYARDNGLLVTADGVPLFWQGAAAVLAILFFLRQIR